MVRCPSAAPGRHPLALSRASWNAASRTKNSQLPVHDTCARPAAGFLGSLAALVGREAPAPRPGHGSHGPRMTLIDVSAALALAAALGGVAWLSWKRGRVRSRNTLLLIAFTHTQSAMGSTAHSERRSGDPQRLSGPRCGARGAGRRKPARAALVPSRWRPVNPSISNNLSKIRRFSPPSNDPSQLLTMLSGPGSFDTEPPAEAFSLRCPFGER